MFNLGNGSVKQLKKRERVVREIWETEEGYVNDLAIVSKVFINPLRESGILSRTEIPQIFGNLEVLYGYNAQFLISLNDRLGPSPLGDAPSADEINELSLANIGDLFIQVATPVFTSTYKTYCKNYRACLDALRYFKERIPEFEPFVKKCEAAEECKALDLGSFLIKPIQRICKYPLLLRELLKCTSDKHSDYEDLKTAIAVFEELAAHIDNAKEDTEAFPDLVRVQEKLDGFQVLTPGRVFIKEGYLMKMSPRKADYYQERYLFLFNDVLVYTRPKKNLKFQKGKRFEYRGAIPLSICLVRDLDPSQVEEEAAGVRQSRLHNKKKSLSKRDLYDSMGADSPALRRKLNSARSDTSAEPPSVSRKRYAFSIIRMDTKKTYIMNAKSPEEKLTWISAIEQVINELLEKKFVGEKPMTGGQAAPALTASTPLAISPDAEIKKEVTFGISTAPSSLTTALAQQPPVGDEAAVPVPSPHSNEGKSPPLSPAAAKSPPSGESLPVSSPISPHLSFYGHAALSMSSSGLTATQSIGSSNKAEIIEGLRRQNNRLRIVNEELEAKVSEMAQEREEQDKEIAKWKQQCQKLELLVDFLVQVTGKSRKELEEIHRWAIEEAEAQDAEESKPTDGVPDAQATETEEVVQAVDTATEKREEQIREENEPSTESQTSEPTAGTSGPEEVNEEDDLPQEKEPEREHVLPQATEASQEAINTEEDDLEQESQGEPTTPAAQAEESVVADQGSEPAPSVEKSSPRQAVEVPVSDNVSLCITTEKKTPLGRKWEEKTKLAAVEHELENKEWQAKKLDLIKIRHPSVRIAVPLEEIRKRFAAAEKGEGVDSDMEKYFPKHLLQPGKSSARPSATSALLSSTSPIPSSAKPSTAPSELVASPPSSASLPSQAELVEKNGKADSGPKVEEPKAPGLSSSGSIPISAALSSSPDGEQSGFVTPRTSFKTAGGSSGSFQLGGYRRDEKAANNDDGSQVKASDEQQSKPSSVKEASPSPLSSSTSITKEASTAEPNAAAPQTTPTPTSTPRTGPLQLDLIRDEFGAASRENDIEHMSLPEPLEMDESELQLLEMRYRMQADREANGGEGKPKYARKVGTIYKKERLGEKWFGCKFVLSKYSLKYFKIRADWETTEPLGEISLIRAKVECCPQVKEKGFCFTVQSPSEIVYLATENEDALRDWMEAIVRCIRDLPLSLRFSYRRDDSLLKGQIETLLRERAQKKEWLISERQRSGSTTASSSGSLILRTSRAVEEGQDGKKRIDGYAFVSTPGQGTSRLLFCACNEGTLYIYNSSRSLSRPLHEFSLEGKSIRARADAGGYVFTLELCDVADRDSPDKFVVRLGFLHEAELRAWHPSLLANVASSSSSPSS